MSRNLAEVCGIHAGDGYMRIRKNHKGEVDISGNLNEKDYYDKHVIPLFNRVFGLNKKGKEFSRGSYGFVFHDRTATETLQNLEFNSGRKSKSVKVPERILNSKDKFLQAAFLRGLFDTDGSLYFKNRKTMSNYSNFKNNHHYYPVIFLGTVSKKLATGISTMLKGLGIKNFIYSYKPNKENEAINYRVTISGEDRLEKWVNIIGMKNEVKLTRYLVWRKFGFCPPHTTLKQRKDILNGRLNIKHVGL